MFKKENHMSFSNAHELAVSRGYNPALLLPDNPADEAVAWGILREAIPERLAAAWGFLAQLAPAVKASGVAWDECLHCTVAGKGALAAKANITQTAGLARGGLVYYAEAERQEILAQLPRLAMFDVPRQVVWDALGIWVEHLFAKEVFIVSPTPVVDVDWAFRRHAVRLTWQGNAEPPECPADESRAVVAAVLKKYRHGWQHLALCADDAVTGEIVIDHRDTQEIADDLHHLAGSLTGRALVNERFGCVFSYYNCHAPSTGPTTTTGKPKTSAVLQLRNQQPEMEHC
jgi:hypothetical protein